MNNEFVINIGGKDYTFTVNRRNRLISQESGDMKISRLYDIGFDSKDITRIMKNPLDIEKIAREKNIELTKILEAMNKAKPTEELIEEMFYRFIIVKHPDIDRERAIELMDIADKEYGINDATGNLFLTDFITSMSQKAFTMSENLERKKVDWFEKEQIEEMMKLQEIAKQANKVKTPKKKTTSQ